MREEIKSHGYKANYTDSQLAKLSASNQVAKERYQVRFMPKSYLNDRATPDLPLSGKMGGRFKGVSGDGVKYWSTGEMMAWISSALSATSLPPAG